MLRIIVDDLVVDLIGENNQFVFTRQLNNRFKNVLRIKRARRIIGIDNNDAACSVSYFFLKIRDIREPVRLFIT